MKKLKVLIWKEWRESGAFFFAMLFLILASGSIVGWIGPERLHQKELWFAVMTKFILPLFASVIATIPFCREFDQKSEDFLLSQSVSPGRIFCVKYVFNLILMLILVTIAQFVYMDVIPAKYGTPFSFMFFMIVIAWHSSVFFSSLLVRNMVAAIFFAPIFAFCISLVLVPFGLAFCVTQTSVVGISLFCIPLSIVLITTSAFIWSKSISKGASLLRILRKISTILIVFFVLSIVVYVCDYVITGIRLNMTIAKAEKVGIVFDINKIIPPEIPDEKNAANVYKRGFELSKKLYKRYPTRYNWKPKAKKKEKLAPKRPFWKLFNKRTTVKSPTASELKTEQKELILNDPEFAELFKIIDKTATLPECYFDINYQEKDVRFMRTMARLNTERIKYYFEEGKNEEAIGAVDSGFAIANALKNDPSLISTLTSQSIVDITIRPLKDISAEVIPVKKYKQWMHNIDSPYKESKEIVLVDISYSYIMLWGSLLDRTCDIHKKMDWMRGRDFVELLYSLHLATPIIKKEAIAYLNFEMKRLKYLKKPYYEIYDKLKLKGMNTKQLVSYFYYKSVICSYLEVLARMKAVNVLHKTFLALKIYKKENGSYPANLAELVPGILPELPKDPFSGKSLIYDRQDDGFGYETDGNGFMLYSVGNNMKDDGGYYEKHRNDDITFICNQ